MTPRSECHLRMASQRPDRRTPSAAVADGATSVRYCRSSSETARPNTEQMRLVAQALAGPALKGGELGEVATGTELAALTKLTANWRSVVEDGQIFAEGPLFRARRVHADEKYSIIAKYDLLKCRVKLRGRR